MMVQPKDKDDSKFSRIVCSFLNDGRNVYIADGGTTAYVYFDDDSDYTSLVLHANGKWEIE